MTKTLYTVCLTILASIGMTNSVSAFNDTAQLRLEVTKVVKEMAAYNKVDDWAIGESGWTSDQYKRFEFLVTTCNDKELLTLTDHKNGAVRVYALWALSKRKYSNFSALLDKHINDNEIVVAQVGCRKLKSELYELVVKLIKDPIVEDYSPQPRQK